MFEISFPDQPGDEAGVLSQELRLALLRNGADPSKVKIVKERSDTMDVGSTVHVLGLVLGAVHSATLLYEICKPAHSGIRIKTSRGTFDLAANEIEIERLRTILAAAESDGHAG